MGKGKQKHLEDRKLSSFFLRQRGNNSCQVSSSHVHLHPHSRLIKLNFSSSSSPSSSFTFPLIATVPPHFSSLLSSSSLSVNLPPPLLSALLPLPLACHHPGAHMGHRGSHRPLQSEVAVRGGGLDQCDCALPPPPVPPQAAAPGPTPPARPRQVDPPPPASHRGGISRPASVRQTAHSSPRGPRSASGSRRRPPRLSAGSINPFSGAPPPAFLSQSARGGLLPQPPLQPPP